MAARMGFLEQTVDPIKVELECVRQEMSRQNLALQAMSKEVLVISSG